MTQVPGGTATNVGVRERHKALLRHQIPERSWRGSGARRCRALIGTFLGATRSCRTRENRHPTRSGQVSLPICIGLVLSTAARCPSSRTFQENHRDHDHHHSMGVRIAWPVTIRPMVRKSTLQFLGDRVKRVGQDALECRPTFLNRSDKPPRPGAVRTIRRLTSRRPSR